MDRPSLKISQTFIDFVKPLMLIVDENTTEDQIQDTFQIAYTVWNAVIMDSVNGDDHYINRLNQTISKHPEFKDLLNQFVSRKKTLFAKDKRLIGNYKVTYKDGNLHVWAEARAPKTNERKSNA